MGWNETIPKMQASCPIVAEQQGGAQVDRIKRLRDEQGIGIYEAKRIVEREDLVADIAKASTIDDIKALLLRII